MIATFAGYRLSQPGLDKALGGGHSAVGRVRRWLLRAVAPAALLLVLVWLSGDMLMAVDFAAPEIVPVNGIRLAVYRDGPDWRTTHKPPIVLLHGWPELAYSWRKQIAALASAGYPVFAPDNRGFGNSDKPAGKDQYAMPVLVGDVAGLLDHYGIEKAVLVGHDWGALVLWALPFYIPERLLGCIGMNVPLFGLPPVDPLTMFRAAYGDDMYIVRFQEEGACEPALERDLARTFRFFFRGPGPNSKGLDDGAFENEKLDLISLLERPEETWGGVPLVSDADVAVYAHGYRDGMTAPLNWYRNFVSNWQDLKSKAGKDGKLPVVEVPCLQFLAELDRACPPALADGMEERCRDLEVILLEGCGHWVQQERTNEINQGMLDWLARKF